MGIPLGVEDFKDRIERNCYYVDKTKFIIVKIAISFRGKKVLNKTQEFK